FDCPTGIYTLSLLDALPILAFGMRDGVLRVLAAGFFLGEAAFAEVVFDAAFLRTAVLRAGVFTMRQSGLPCGVGREALYRPCFVDRKSTRLNSSHVKISYAV